MKVKIEQYIKTIIHENGVFEKESEPCGDTYASYDVCVNLDECQKMAKDELLNNFDQLNQDYEFITLDDPAFEVKKIHFNKIVEELL